MKLRARIYGIPRPQGSPSAFRWQAKDGRSGIAITEGDRLKGWRATLSAVLQKGKPDVPIEREVTLTAIFYLPAPKKKSKLKAPAKKPDLDKLLRAVGDAMTKVWIKDDALICKAVIEKRWATEHGDEAPGAYLEVRTWDEAV